MRHLRTSLILALLATFPAGAGVKPDHARTPAENFSHRAAGVRSGWTML
ncbi:MAG: hypothetical protein OEQ13_02115 [Acidobacteriota bacterium]|nr:hypothetical protein [Acidobacteriota bacterium]